MRIRPAIPDDRDACYAIAVATGDDGQPADHLHRYPQLIGEVYVGPYLALEPAHCLVLADEHDIVRGYVLGTPDTLTFERRAEREWWPAVRTRTAGDVEPRPADAVLLAMVAEPPAAPAELVAQYPAHGHIDLLPSAQGGGWGRALMDELARSLLSAGAPAMHLGVSAANSAALAFYARLGFAVVLTTGDTVFVGRDLTPDAAEAVT